ncbi:helix-hairpin-helix domain-containing protein [Micromonospora sediminimaris]|uniref:helix-hairpin-helix domain-containing protein n=1 Tax=Micromonospora sediminimaris TaxID=547162 RepID=UPI0037A8B3D5
MGESFGSWLILLVALLAGLAVGWVLLRGRRSEPPAPTAGTASDATTEASGSAPVAAGTAQSNTATEPTTEPASGAPAGTGTTTPTQAEPTEAEPAPTAAAESTGSTAEEPLTGTPTGATRVGEPLAGDVDPSSIHAGPTTDTTADTSAEPRSTVATPPVRPKDTTEPATAASAADPVATEPAVAVDPIATEPAVAAHPVVTEPAAAAEPVSAEPVAAQADDFRRIQGVGPKMAAALHGAGIRTYRQLAELDEAALRETVKSAGLRATASLATWPQQAKVLAAQADSES